VNEPINDLIKAMKAQTEATTRLLERVDAVLWLLSEQAEPEQLPFKSLSDTRTIERGG
jgi:hypothetical protein